MTTSKLTPANENPWYVLMTLYGEQEGEEIDWQLAEKNRALWSSWLVSEFSRTDADEHLKRVGPPNAVQAFGDMSSKAFKQLLLNRARHNSNLKLPEPGETIDLRNTHFDRPLVLPRSLFGAVFTDGSIFDDQVYFRGSEFLDNVDFSNTTFKGELNFGEATFAGRMRMQRTGVIGKVRMDASEFKHGAVISNCRFSDGARFGGAGFQAEVSFLETRFEKKADFVMARFDGLAHFDGAVFGTPTSGLADVDDFSFATFLGPTSFEHAKFTSQFPLLTGTTLNETTTITPEPENWPPLKRAYGKFAPRDQGKTAGFHYRIKSSAAKLRHAMSRQSLPEEEHFFFRREMHHAARAEPLWRTAHIRLFEIVSDFGYSIARPANFLLALWLLGAFFYFEATTFGLFEALGYSFSNMFKFFGLHRTYFDFELIRLWPGWLQWVSGAQTVLAFILLFFLGLGLRTRFRLR